MLKLDYVRTQLPAVLVIAAVCPLAAAEPSAEDMKDAAERKAREAATLQARIDELDAARKEFGRKQQYGHFKRLSMELNDARSQLAAVLEATVEDFARKMAEEQRQAEVAARAERRLEQDAQRKTADEAVLNKWKEEKEARRLELSGGCPLEITRGDFFHYQKIPGVNQFGPRDSCTVVKFVTVNRSIAPVESYELLIQFYNGFDILISEHKLERAMLNSKAALESSEELPLNETATTMQIHVQRTQKRDGMIWEREPQHRCTGFILEKPEAAIRLD